MHMLVFPARNFSSGTLHAHVGVSSVEFQLTQF